MVGEAVQPILSGAEDLESFYGNLSRPLMWLKLPKSTPPQTPKDNVYEHKTLPSSSTLTWLSSRLKASKNPLIFALSLSIVSPETSELLDQRSENYGPKGQPAACDFL